MMKTGVLECGNNIPSITIAHKFRVSMIFFGGGDTPKTWCDWDELQEIYP